MFKLVVLGRREFAAAFELVYALADEPGEVADACVTLAVHAGIAAADVVCCARLGRYSTSDRHEDALALLSKASSGQEKHLYTLLKMKSRAGYSHEALTLADLRKAKRAMQSLIAAMDDLPSS